MGFIFRHAGKDIVVLKTVTKNNKEYFVVPKGTKVPEEWLGAKGKEPKLHTEYRETKVKDGIVLEDLYFDKKYPAGVGTFLYGRTAPAFSILEVDLNTGVVLKYFGKKQFPENLPKYLNIDIKSNIANSLSSDVVYHKIGVFDTIGVVNFRNKNNTSGISLPLDGTTISTSNGVTSISYSDGNYTLVRFDISVDNLELDIVLEDV